MDRTQPLPLRRREKARKASRAQCSEDEPRRETWDRPVAFLGPRPLTTTVESGHTQSEGCACRQPEDKDTRAEGCVGEVGGDRQPARRPGRYPWPRSAGLAQGSWRAVLLSATATAQNTQRVTTKRALNGMRNKDSLDSKPGLGRLCGQASPTIRSLASPSLGLFSPWPWPRAQG